MEYDIFISYSRADTQNVDQFVTKLTDAGYRVWIDREGIDGGDQFKTKIVRAIKNSALVVFFSSANSNASKWTVKEISYSLKNEKTIIPVKLDEAEYAESIDFDLIDIDFIQYQPNRFKSTNEQLNNAIKRHLGDSTHLDRPATTDQNKTHNQSQKTHSFKSTISRLLGHTPDESSPDRLFFLGDSYFDKNDYLHAVHYFKLAAELGHAEAQSSLGHCFYKGLGVKQNPSEAVKWFRKSAEQGNPSAQSNLGFCLFRGEGIPQDKEEAVKWFQKAAEQGDACAQYNLGLCYQEGNGILQDNNEAVKWYEKAAKQKYADALCNLGYCYEMGLGVPKDLQKAIELYRKSAKQGNKKAIENLKILGKWPK